MRLFKLENISQLKIQSFFGIFTPVITLFYILILGLLKPNYNQFTMTISYLGAGKSFLSSLASFFFILTGLFLIYFSVGLYNVLKSENKINIGLFIILFSMLDLIVSGLFPTDLNINSMSFTGFIHTLGSSFGDLFLLIGFFLFWLKDYQVFDSKSARYFSLITLVITIASISINFLFHFMFISNFQYGLIQKVEFTFIFMFISYLGIQLFNYNQNTKVS